LQGNELVLGPFQGSLACTRIPLNKGVCGACAAGGKTIIVPDVDAFPGHIACSVLSRSEITVPLADARGITQLVLDVDSNVLNDFDETDARYLEKIMELLKPLLPAA
ncbi:GAF domain-containing protein, partial [Sphingobacteriales bacterium UPWRP_1]